MTTYSVEELRRAVGALESGRFRGDSMLRQEAASEWRPPGEALAVVGVLPRSGASVVALALAESAERPVHLVEAGPSHRSSLASASTAELGAIDESWRRSRRGAVLIDRLASSPRLPNEVGPPPSSDGQLTILDVGWETSALVRDEHWLSRQVGSMPTVLVATASGPGLRALDSSLADLHDSQIEAAVVVGSSQRRWGWPLKVASSTSAIQHLRDSGRLFTVPLDSELAATGVTTDPLPAALLRGARSVLARVAGPQEPRELA
ncbi:hypothetical protein ASD11_14580 [Aeromicrobium sp. Root495]|nr:hypothetical protein ASD11_14580 [Aeromicrobium sp. Root495]